MIRRAICLTPLLLAACAADTTTDPLADYVEVRAATILDAPSALPGRYAPANAEQVRRGEYLVELLGCGSCHTDGALIGEPDMKRALAGSRVGIAWNNPLGNEFPGVVFAPNITPDPDTGIGNWTDSQIAAAIRAGTGRHGDRAIRVMPWPGYVRMSDEDVAAMVAYLRSIAPVDHRVPDEVRPGQRSRQPFVYFGYFRSR